MNKQHNYKLTAQWHGNKGTGTSGLRDYDRSHTDNPSEIGMADFIIIATKSYDLEAIIHQLH